MNAERQTQKDDADDQPDIVAIYQAELAAHRRIVVPTTLRDPHPIVAGLLKEWGTSPSSLGRSDPIRARSIRIFHALLKAAEQMGFAVEQRPSFPKLYVSYRTAHVEMHLHQRIRQYRRPLTDAEKEQQTRFGILSGKFRQVKEHTGVLVLSLRVHQAPASFPDNVPRSWEDQPDRPIEQVLDQALASIVTGIAIGQRELELHFEREAQRRRAEEDREARRREREREKERRENLGRDAKAWRQAVEIRAYIAAVQQRIEEGGSVSLPFDPELWVQWASSAADDLDPLAANQDAAGG